MPLEKEQCSVVTRVASMHMFHWGLIVLWMSLVQIQESQHSMPSSLCLQEIYEMENFSLSRPRNKETTRPASEEGKGWIRNCLSNNIDDAAPIVKF